MWLWQSKSWEWWRMEAHHTLTIKFTIGQDYSVVHKYALAWTKLWCSAFSLNLCACYFTLQIRVYLLNTSQERLCRTLYIAIYNGNIDHNADKISTCPLFFCLLLWLVSIARWRHPSFLVSCSLLVKQWILFSHQNRFRSTEERDIVAEDWMWDSRGEKNSSPTPCKICLKSANCVLKKPIFCRCEEKLGDSNVIFKLKDIQTSFSNANPLGRT